MLPHRVSIPAINKIRAIGRLKKPVHSKCNICIAQITRIDGIVINGVDLIRWNDAGQIVDFKVMLRPLKAVNLIHQMMKQMLEQL